MLDKDTIELLCDYDVDVTGLKREIREFVEKLSAEWYRNCLKDDNAEGLPYLVAYMYYDESEIVIKSEWVSELEKYIVETVRVDIIEPIQAISLKEWVKNDFYYEKTGQIPLGLHTEFVKKFPLVVYKFDDIMAEFANILEERGF